MSKKKTEENPNAFKLWINADVVTKYFRNTSLTKTKINTIISELESRELKARVQLIAQELKVALPTHYPLALKQLLKIAQTEKLESFELWPVSEFIQQYGLEHREESLKAMQAITVKFTSEFCIRPFLNRYGKTIYDHLLPLTQHKSEHIRRWVSEGTRPVLPWGEKLKAAVTDPHPGLNILEQLKYDSSLYVRKSVANHLNDITKTHPEVVIKTLNRWKKNVPSDNHKEFEFIVNRALRTLIKNGHSGALKLVGIQNDTEALKCTGFKVQPQKVQVGEKLEFQFQLQNLSKKLVSFLVDYVVYFKKSNGQLSPKVFKLKKGKLAAQEKITITKQHSFKPITTRVYYPGEHQIALKVNGQELGKKRFELSESKS